MLVDLNDYEVTLIAQGLSILKAEAEETISNSEDNPRSIARIIALDDKVTIDKIAEKMGY